MKAQHWAKFLLWIMGCPLPGMVFHRNRQASSRVDGSGLGDWSSQLLKFLEEEGGPHNNALESHLGSLQVQALVPPWAQNHPHCHPRVLFTEWQEWLPAHLNPWMLPKACQSQKSYLKKLFSIVNNQFDTVISSVDPVIIWQISCFKEYTWNI